VGRTHIPHAGVDSLVSGLDDQLLKLINGRFVVKSHVVIVEHIRNALPVVTGGLAEGGDDHSMQDDDSSDDDDGPVADSATTPGA